MTGTHVWSIFRLIGIVRVLGSNKGRATELLGGLIEALHFRKK